MYIFASTANVKISVGGTRANRFWYKLRVLPLPLLLPS